MGIVKGIDETLGNLMRDMLTIFSSFGQVGEWAQRLLKLLDDINKITDELKEIISFFFRFSRRMTFIR